MNTVDALNVLGKVLCGDSFEVKPGLTDAETILEIAKNYTGGGARVISLEDCEETPDGVKYEEGLSATDLAGARFVYPANGDTAVAVIKIATYSDEIGTILCETDLSQLPKFRYYPETGIISPSDAI